MSRSTLVISRAALLLELQGGALGSVTAVRSSGWRLRCQRQQHFSLPARAALNCVVATLTLAAETREPFVARFKSATDHRVIAKHPAAIREENARASVSERPRPTHRHHQPHRTAAVHWFRRLSVSSASRTE